PSTSKPEKQKRQTPQISTRSKTSTAEIKYNTAETAKMAANVATAARRKSSATIVARSATSSVNVGSEEEEATARGHTSKEAGKETPSEEDSPMATSHMAPSSSRHQGGRPPSNKNTAYKRRKLMKIQRCKAVYG
ncbi:hypothetical protein HDU96_003700, partial [Phlyctochytrium bullatum]